VADLLLRHLAAVLLEELAAQVSLLLLEVAALARSGLMVAAEAADLIAFVLARIVEVLCP
jgi:hypothetical protein